MAIGRIGPEAFWYFKKAKNKGSSGRRKYYHFSCLVYCTDHFILVLD
jgi:hypothetical protein